MGRAASLLEPFLRLTSVAAETPAVPHPRIQLKVRAQGRHPWFYRKMINKPQRPIAAGSAVDVTDRDGNHVGTGFYNSRTQLALRMLDRDQVDDPQRWLEQRLTDAAELRDRQLRLPEVTSGYRLVHSEGDGFPGLILDRLGDSIVAQVFSLCMHEHIEGLGEQLLRRYPGTRLVLTIDQEAARREGIPRCPPPTAHETEVIEHGVRFAVRPGLGHKTGFFADQRDQRQLIRGLSSGRRVLDLCCYGGGFAISAALGGAREVVAADLDEEAVEAAIENADRNKAQVRFEHGDAFDVLRDTAPGAFDLVVLDPPKWASGKGEVDRALRRYRDLNRLAFAALEPGGILLTCSCSGAVSEDRFLATLREAAAQAGRDAVTLQVAGAGPDHPVALECPQTRYLKAALLQIR